MSFGKYRPLTVSKLTLLNCGLTTQRKNSTVVKTTRGVFPLKSEGSEFPNYQGFLMINLQKYRFVCTLTFGDVYGQIIVWLITITLSLASALALMGARRPVYALATVGLVVLLSLPFLLFAFVTTLINHIELSVVEPGTEMQPIPSNISQQQPATN